MYNCGMTTYILHGGKTSKPDPRNEEFFGQFSKLVNKEEVTVLLCYFSREKERWEALSKRDSDSIKNNADKKVNILVAENPDDLLKKMDEADVLYVAGGESYLIEPLYEAMKNIGAKLNGKVYAGSSMGAFFAAEQYVLSLDGQDIKAVHKGMGLLPIQVLAHWNIEKNKEAKLKLLTESSDKPIIALNEFEYVVFYRQ
jgi:peptidase E